jgi:hypothetical protein
MEEKKKVPFDKIIELEKLNTVKTAHLKSNTDNFAISILVVMLTITVTLFISGTFTQEIFIFGLILAVIIYGVSQYQVTRTDKDFWKFYDFYLKKIQNEEPLPSVTELMESVTELMKKGWNVNRLKNC